MENALRFLVAGHDIPADLTITYDDLHGLWGGIAVTVRGDGSVERHTRTIGAPETEVMRTQIDRRALRELIALLLDLEAWKQRTPASPPVPDESRARLTIRVGTSASSIWERFEEMPANNRLLQLKTRMAAL